MIIVVNGGYNHIKTGDVIIICFNYFCVTQINHQVSSVVHFWST